MSKTLKYAKFPSSKKGIVVLEPNPSNVVGVITFTEETDNKRMRIQYDIQGLTDGAHGFHIHQYGDLRNGCVSAGPHFNPYHHAHGGLESPSTHRHLGDLGNIISKNGKAKETLYAPHLKLKNGKTAIIGRMIVVHENQDDLGLGTGKLKKESLITGNAGKRIACGIIGLSS